MATKRVQRVQLACVPCRQGKLKCSRESPVCDQCHKRTRELACVYTERGLRYNAAMHKSENMKEKLERLEHFVNQIKAQQTDSASGHDGGSHPHDPVAIESGPQQIAAPDALLTAQLGSLTVSNTGSTEWIGPSHWESIIEDISDVKAYFDLESSPGSSGHDKDTYVASQTSILDIDIPFDVSATLSVQDIVQLLPPKLEVDRLVAAFFTAFDILRLLLHVPTFQAEYQRFWSNTLAVDPAWLACLVTVISIGAEIMGQERGDFATLVQAEDLRRLSAHALVMADYTKPQPYLLETMLLYLKCILLKDREVTAKSWLFLGLITRFATRAGYHREPSHNKAITPLDAEMRRRVWMFVREYDIVMSYNFGLVSVIHKQNADTRNPGNYLDTDLTGEVYVQPRPDSEYTHMLLAITYHRLVTIFGDIVYLASTPSPDLDDHNNLHSEIRDLHLSLDRTQDKLHPMLKLVPLDQALSDPTEILLTRIFLEIMFLKAKCVLFRRYVGAPAHPAEHKECLGASQELVQRVIELLQACQPGARLESCKAFIPRIVHDFNLAAMLLCSELKRQSESMEKHIRKDVELSRGLLLRSCELWRGVSWVAPKAGHALRAIERYLQSQTPGSNNGAGSTLLSYDHGPGGPFGAKPPTTFTPFSVNRFQQPFNMAAGSIGQMAGYDVQNDPMFLNLFGATTEMPVLQDVDGNFVFD